LLEALLKAGVHVQIVTKTKCGRRGRVHGGAAADYNVVVEVLDEESEVADKRRYTR
jgi:hypothetical protein